MKNINLEIGFNELSLSEEAIINIIGYSSQEELGLLNSLVPGLMRLAGDVCRIKAQYSIFDDIGFENDTAELKVRNVIFNPGRIIYGQLKKSELITLFLCTAGSEIGNVSRQAMIERDLLKGYVLDVIGSEMVEAAADLMQIDIERSFFSSGYKISNRYSPGYCGWDVSEQGKLFELMPRNYCGIKLNDSSLMDPVKSVSGIIGLGSKVKKLPYTCSLCDMTNCIYRAKRK
ncbi:MAG TPA: vitamin B12 dependent-methionine synthase activation domain-containing protein [Bacteroidales bacterium]|nr:vitamin B12 dependent-methionine synthase activation domain-containing protein [Bacteroidales bacterium]